MTSLLVEGGGQARGGEMLPTLPVGERASALRGEEAGRFREVAACPSLMRVVHVHSRHFNGKQPTVLARYK